MAELQVHTGMLPDALAFVSLWDEIKALRFGLGVHEDVLLDPLHFLATTDDIRRSCAVACWRGEQLIGVMYATEHFLKGLGTGYAVGGDYSGRGLLLCAPADESLVLRECVRRVVSEGIHSLHLRFLPRDATRLTLAGLKMKFLDAVIPGDRMKLRPTFDEFVATLGKHTRRNLRACTRKAEAAGIQFVPCLSEAEYRAGVEHLNAETDFPADVLRLARDERLLLLHGGGKRLGLRGPDGQLVAVLCGFRLGDRFHLLTQLNDAHFERLSLSLVLRGYAVAHLIGTGHREIQFMGGSSLSLGRYCQPEIYRSIFIDKTGGLAAAAKQLCSSIASLVARMEKPIPETLAMLCSGHLDECALCERTALRPAAMLSRDAQTATDLVRNG